MPKDFFDISTGFRFSKLQFGSVPSIPVAVLGLTLEMAIYVLSYYILSNHSFHQALYYAILPHL